MSLNPREPADLEPLVNPTTVTGPFNWNTRNVDRETDTVWVTINQDDRCGDWIQRFPLTAHEARSIGRSLIKASKGKL